MEVELNAFEAKMSLLGAFPAKDIINDLSKTASNLKLAKGIVDRMRRKIHTVGGRWSWLSSPGIFTFDDIRWM